jgi:Flp pilus assembly protein TadD
MLATPAAAIAAGIAVGRRETPSPSSPRPSSLHGGVFPLRRDMTRPQSSTPSPVFPSERLRVRLAGSALALLTIAAFLTSFRGALVFDDIPGIANNPTIRDLSHPRELLVAIGPQGGTLSGRPIPNLTLALNHAISGDDLWSYHATNLLIHLGAALLLFGLVRRSLSLPSLQARFGRHATWLAFAIALLWSVHPLQTESVTYLIQRVESLMGVCYLLTLYCFARTANSPVAARWRAGAFAACLAGMACKEVMVSAPIAVAWFDSTFVAGSWREAWRRRARFHGALMSTWIVLAALVLASGGRGGTAGFGVGISWWRYAFTQCEAIVTYVKLAFWPWPLVFDHHARFADGLADVWPQALLVIGLLVSSIGLIIRRPAAGFPCAVFFLVLAPTSSVVPVDDAIVEHRMYLPLAAVIALFVLAAFTRLGRAVVPASAGAALALGLLAANRNLDYRSPLALWSDTVRKNPASSRAHNNLGAYLLEAGRTEEAQTRFATALQIDPRYASAHYNLAKLQEKTGQTEEAVASYSEALRLSPKLADAQVNLGTLLDRLGRHDEAVTHYRAALALDPGAPDVHGYLGAALLKLKRAADARVQLEMAAELDPTRPEVWLNLARAQQQLGELPAAQRAAERALQLAPNAAEAHYVLGNLAAARGDFASAAARFRRAVELSPSYFAARNNLANALLLAGDVDAAIEQYRQLLRERPDDRAVQENLARALEAQGGLPGR